MSDDPDRIRVTTARPGSPADREAARGCAMFVMGCLAGATLSALLAFALLLLLRP